MFKVKDTKTGIVSEFDDLSSCNLFYDTHPRPYDLVDVGVDDDK